MPLLLGVSADDARLSGYNRLQSGEGRSVTDEKIYIWEKPPDDDLDKGVEVRYIREILPHARYARVKGGVEYDGPLKYMTGTCRARPLYRKEGGKHYYLRTQVIPVREVVLNLLPPLRRGERALHHFFTQRQETGSENYRMVLEDLDEKGTHSLTFLVPHVPPSDGKPRSAERVKELADQIADKHIDWMIMTRVIYDTVDLQGFVDVDRAVKRIVKFIRLQMRDEMAQGGSGSASAPSQGNGNGQELSAVQVITHEHNISPHRLLCRSMRDGAVYVSELGQLVKAACKTLEEKWVEVFNSESYRGPNLRRWTASPAVSTGSTGAAPPPGARRGTGLAVFCEANTNLCMPAMPEGKQGETMATSSHRTRVCRQVFNMGQLPVPPVVEDTEERRPLPRVDVYRCFEDDGRNFEKLAHPIVPTESAAPSDSSGDLAAIPASAIRRCISEPPLPRSFPAPAALSFLCLQTNAHKDRPLPSTATSSVAPAPPPAAAATSSAVPTSPPAAAATSSAVPPSPPAAAATSSAVLPSPPAAAATSSAVPPSPPAAAATSSAVPPSLPAAAATSSVIPTPTGSEVVWIRKNTFWHATQPEEQTSAERRSRSLPPRRLPASTPYLLFMNKQQSPPRFITKHSDGEMRGKDRTPEYDEMPIVVRCAHPDFFRKKCWRCDRPGCDPKTCESLKEGNGCSCCGEVGHWKVMCRCEVCKPQGGQANHIRGDPARELTAHFAFVEVLPSELKHINWKDDESKWKRIELDPATSPEGVLGSPAQETDEERQPICCRFWFPGRSQRQGTR